MNSYKEKPDKEADTVVQVERPNLVTTRLAPSNSFFKPQLPGNTPPTASSAPDLIEAIPSPEKKLTLFALYLAVLEKAASGLGTLAFVWATVVLLGGFPGDLTNNDFWFVTVILVSEGARIFGRSHELKWQHQHGRSGLQVLKSSSKSLLHAIRASAKFERDQNQQIKPASVEDQESQNKHVSNQNQIVQNGRQMPLPSYSDCVFLSKSISSVFVSLQMISAIACMTISLFRLVKGDYGDAKRTMEISDHSTPCKQDNGDKENLRPALVLFYSLALAEAIMFLLQKAYWSWKILPGDLFERVSKDCELGTEGIITMQRYFYNTYSKCLAMSIFDGIKMDLVTFAGELLESTFMDEQLIGVMVLRSYVKNKNFSFETLRKIGTNMRVIERLIEMLNWKRVGEEKIRKAAAEIVSELAGKRHSALYVACIPGSIESISSLLGNAGSGNDISDLNLLGLKILRQLSRDHDNCSKISNTRGLLPRVIQFTGTTRSVLQTEHDVPSQIRTVEQSLKVVERLVSTPGCTGKILREEISNVVFTVSNMRNILEFGGGHVKLQRLAIDILTALAMDEKAKERIAKTGGVVRLLFSIIFSPPKEGESCIRTEAGDAIAMLALNSRRNCKLIMKKTNVAKLVVALGDPNLRLNASRILRSLCASCGDECKDRLNGVATAMPYVLEATIMEKGKLQEVSIGLTYQICKLYGPNPFISELRRTGIPEEKYIKVLVNILTEYEYPSVIVPRIRRFVVQQAIWMMEHSTNFVELFRIFGIEKLLEAVGNTTSDLEEFHIFAGSVGLCQQSQHVSTLVEDALDLLAGGSYQKEM